MRAGLAFSAVGHLALLLWGFVLFASPKQFAPIPPESITVDIVPAVTLGQDFEERRPAESAAARQPPGPIAGKVPSKIQRKNPRTELPPPPFNLPGKSRGLARP